MVALSMSPAQVLVRGEGRRERGVMKYRVYKATDTPLEGSDEFFDVSTQRMAIKLAKYLNAHTDYKKWVWASA